MPFLSARTPRTNPPPRRVSAGIRHVLAVCVLLTGLAASTLVVSDIVTSPLNRPGAGTFSPAVPATSPVNAAVALCDGPQDCVREVRKAVRKAPTPSLPSSAYPRVTAPSVARAPKAPARSVPAPIDTHKSSAER